MGLPCPFPVAPPSKAPPTPTAPRRPPALLSPVALPPRPRPQATPTPPNQPEAPPPLLPPPTPFLRPAPSHLAPPSLLVEEAEPVHTTLPQRPWEFTAPGPPEMEGALSRTGWKITPFPQQEMEPTPGLRADGACLVHSTLELCDPAGCSGNSLSSHSWGQASALGGGNYLWRIRPAQIPGYLGKISHREHSRSHGQQLRRQKHFSGIRKLPKLTLIRYHNYEPKTAFQKGILS